MPSRKMFRLLTWPDPLVQERIEDMAFFYDTPSRAWVRFADEEETGALSEWLKKHHLRFLVSDANGQGELKKHPCLSDALILKDGGSPTACALCGARHVACRQWVEGDDADSTEYPQAAKFYLCGKCVQDRMACHPRLYAPAPESL